MIFRDRGFTLIELMISLSLMTIVITMAVPAISDLIARNRQNALLGQVQTALQNARATAVLQRKSVVLCGSSDASTCTSSWANGWLTKTSATDEVLTVTQLPHADELRWSGFGQSIRFHDNGTNPASNGRFYQCHKEKIAWQLILNRQGRLRIGTPAENASKVELCRPDPA